MNYLYTTMIYTDINGLIGFDITQNNLDKTDFETNYKSSCVGISGLALAETTVRIDKTYAQFKALITGAIVWGDIKLSTMAKRYELYLVTTSPL